MRRSTSILLSAPPPLWASQRTHLARMMRDLGAPAILIDGRLMDTPFGPRIVATLGVPDVMGPVPLLEHPSYRPAMRDAAGMMSYVRMIAMSHSGIDPVTASREPEDVVWSLAALPSGMVLLAQTRSAEFGPFLLWTETPSPSLIDRVERQFAFLETVSRRAPDRRVEFRS